MKYHQIMKRMMAAALAASMTVTAAGCGSGKKAPQSGAVQEVDTADLEFPLKEKATLTGLIPTNNPRNINLNIRISQKESDLIQECADKLKTARVNVIIKGVEMVKADLEKK